MPPQIEGFQILALTDAGFALVHQRDFPRDKTLHLQPWAHVSGNVRIGTKPAANLRLRAQPEEVDTSPSEDESGIFRLHQFHDRRCWSLQPPTVMPGHYDIIRVVPNGVRRVTSVNMAGLDVAAGRSYDLKIGGSGRPVTGRLVLPANIPWMTRNATIEPKTATGKPIQLGIQISVDGRFRADNIDPGEYKLRISIHEPPPDDAWAGAALLARFLASLPSRPFLEAYATILWTSATSNRLPSALIRCKLVTLRRFRREDAGGQRSHTRRLQGQVHPPRLLGYVVRPALRRDPISRPSMRRLPRPHGSRWSH